MKLIKLLPVAVLAVAGGCQNPGVVQMSPGTYVLSRADHGGIFGNKDALKAGVIQDANTFAESKGKVAVPVSAREHPVGIMGDWASYEYVFKLVDKNSPEAAMPVVLVRTDSFRAGGATSLGSKDTFYTAQSAPPVSGRNETNGAAASSTARSPSERLLELKKLLDAGAITPAEYEAKKKELLEKL